MHTTKITNPSSLTLIVSLIAAAGIHIYLTQLHLITKYGTEPASQLCNISSQVNCNVAISSKFSELIGIPIALFGFMTTLMALLFTLKFFLFSDSEESESVDATAVLSLTGLAVIASLIMGGISFFAIKTLCPFCAAEYILSVISLVSAWKIFPKEDLFNGKSLKTLVAIGAIILLGSFASGKISVNKFESSDAREMYSLILQEWKQATPQKIELFNPIRTGKEGAKMKIVEYADFLCHHCMNAAEKVSLFLKGHPDVEFVFQAFPLDGCEKFEGKYGKRCELAMFSVCANEQGHGYEINEILFQRQELMMQDPVSDLAKEGLSPQLTEVSRIAFLDAEKIVACLKDPKTYETLVKQKDYAAKTLQVNSTPTFFINDKQIKGAGNISVLQKTYFEINQ